MLYALKPLRQYLQHIGLILTTALAAVGYGWAADLPPDKYQAWSIEKEIFVPMRDGVHLSTDVLLPKGATEKLPTVLVRTPYDKDKEFMVFHKWPELFVKQGYAVVWQNERGRYFSEGHFENYLQGASTDGHDTIDWIAKQPWSNGKVGTFGCSSSGEQQWPMAASNHPGHAAMIPAASGTAVGNVPGNETRGSFYRGGVPWINFWAWWYSNLMSSERLLLPPNSTQEQRVRLRNTYSLTPKFVSQMDGFKVPTIETLPSKDILRGLGRVSTAFDNYITWTPGDERWNEVEFIGAGAKPRVPGVGETTRLFKYLQDSGTPNQYLIIGAGPHCVYMTESLSGLKGLDLIKLIADRTPDQKVSGLNGYMYIADTSDLRFGDLEVGDARYGGVDRGYTKLFLNWFGYWLNNEQNHIMEMPRVQLYVMGEGWISGDQWPLKETRFTKYYLSRDPVSRSRQGAGVLSTSLPSRNDRTSYAYDPGSPTPSRDGSFFFAAALDQRSIEVRKDVLSYSTSLLDKPVTIAGPIEVVLYISSSVKDTDFIVKLIDVYPDGKAINLSDDAFRVRYRQGFDKKVLMRPGNVYRLSLSNMVAAVRFPKGHRIQLDISSSSVPAYERNLNTGGNNYDETTWVVAENSIHHGPQYPSQVVLPVLID